MRDLEIRGAGNLLGPEQHGYISAVGFDLYCRLLDQALRELRGEMVDDTPDPTIDINVAAFIPPGRPAPHPPPRGGARARTGAAAAAHRLRPARACHPRPGRHPHAGAALLG